MIHSIRALSWLLVVSGLLAAPALAAPPTPPFGLNLEGSQYGLISNDLWRVTVNGGSPVTAKEVVMVQKARSGTTATDRQDSAYIWAPACTAAKQTLIFRRVLYMPGVPKTFAAQFSDTTFQSPPAEMAISGVRVFINDRHAFSFRGASARVNTTATFYPTLFREGLNEIEIHVTKRAKSGTSIGQCRYGTRPLGFHFYMYGEYEADLWLSNDQYTTEEFYQRVAGGQRIVVSVPIPVRNFGPSTAYRGFLTATISGSTLKSFRIWSVSVRGLGVEDCRTTTLHAFSARIDCALDRLRKTDRPELLVRVDITFHPSFDTAYLFQATLIHSPTRDPVGINQGRRAILYYCGPQATNTKCPP